MTLLFPSALALSGPLSFSGKPMKLKDCTAKRYMLRRTMAPWKFQETIDEAVDFARTYGVDEIIWKIDTEEFSHGLPTLELIRGYVPWLIKSREQLAAAGVSMSINPWVTQGMRDAGWDNRQIHPDMEWLTDISGLAAKSQGCPLSPGWRQWFFDAYEIYASTAPRVLWIEDDFRVHRHRPVWYACFCKRHIEEFSRLAGRNFTREELAREILQPGLPTATRERWMAFEGSVMAEVLELLGQRVAKANPGVQLGLMLNQPSMSAMEIRDWDRCMAAISQGRDFVTVRPGMVNYQEGSPRGLYAGRSSVSGVMACIRKDAHLCTEIENWSFSRYSKSVRFTRAQVLLSAAMRCQSMTFNMYDRSTCTTTWARRWRPSRSTAKCSRKRGQWWTQWSRHWARAASSEACESSNTSRPENSSASIPAMITAS
jgi:hypothetical protein